MIRKDSLFIDINHLEVYLLVWLAFIVHCEDHDLVAWVAIFELLRNFQNQLCQLVSHFLCSRKRIVSKVKDLER